MPARPQERRPDEPGDSGRPFWFGERIPLGPETLAFIFANVLDIVLTYRLLLRGAERLDPVIRIVEGNPVARFFLDHWGVSGMVYYKMGMVAFVCVVTQLIARRSVKTARRLLYLLTAIVGAVVLYSSYLLMRSV